MQNDVHTPFNVQCFNRVIKLDIIDSPPVLGLRTHVFITRGNIEGRCRKKAQTACTSLPTWNSVGPTGMALVWGPSRTEVGVPYGPRSGYLTGNELVIGFVNMKIESANLTL